MQVSNIVKTIGEQLIAKNPFFREEFHVTDLIAMNKDTLRLHSRSRHGIFNIDIHYNHVTDLYDVAAYRLRNHGLDCTLVFFNGGYFWDQLEDVIRGIISS